MAEKQRLKLDLAALFPGESITIGSQPIDIRPLGIQQLAILARKFKGFGTALGADGVTWENYNTPDSLLKLAVVLLDEFPEVLEECTNIAIEDLQALPIDIGVELVDKVLEVNLQSKERLEGNFASLVRKLNLTQAPSPKSQKRSKS